MIYGVGASELDKKHIKYMLEVALLISNYEKYPEVTKVPVT